MDRKIKTIIYVDDDEIICMITKRLLEQLEVAREVFVFSDSLKALVFLKEKYSPSPTAMDQEQPDLIILDIDMPGMGGFEIMGILKELKKPGHIDLKNTHFVIVTSHKTDREVQMAERYHALTILEKPLRVEDISDLISKVP